MWQCIFVDSISSGTEQWMEWCMSLLENSPFAPSPGDDADFPGCLEWNCAPIINQMELECGAQTCIHAAILATSKLSHWWIMRELGRVKDLSNAARHVVAKTCETLAWQMPGWLCRITLSDTMLVQAQPYMWRHLWVTLQRLSLARSRPVWHDWQFDLWHHLL
jgi:hypothetical protein